ncbi:hypothetical protein A2U01_0014461, partial [Trifolium medium]|nr:hypothetical protein [Trifolium medium]
RRKYKRARTKGEEPKPSSSARSKGQYRCYQWKIHSIWGIPRYPSPPHTKAGIVKLIIITNTLPLAETSPFRDRRLLAQTHFQTPSSLVVKED